MHLQTYTPVNNSSSPLEDAEHNRVTSPQSVNPQTHTPVNFSLLKDKGYNEGLFRWTGPVTFDVAEYLLANPYKYAECANHYGGTNRPLIAKEIEERFIGMVIARNSGVSISKRVDQKIDSFRKRNRTMVCEEWERYTIYDVGKKKSHIR